MPHIELNARVNLPVGADWPAVGGDTRQSTWFWRTHHPAAPLRSVDWVVREQLIPANRRNMVFQLNCAPNRDGLLDDNVVARLKEVGQAWSPPPPLPVIPESWKDWPVPSSVQLLTGRNLAKGKPVRLAPNQKIKSAAAVVDGDPQTSVDLGGARARGWKLTWGGSSRWPAFTSGIAPRPRTSSWNVAPSSFPTNRTSRTTRPRFAVSPASTRSPFRSRPAIRLLIPWGGLAAMSASCPTWGDR